MALLGSTHLLKPRPKEIIEEYATIPWPGVVWNVDVGLDVDASFLFLRCNGRPGKPETSFYAAALIADLYDRPARYKRWFIAYALTLVRARRPGTNFSSATGANLCRAIDELRGDLKIPPRVIRYMRGVLGEYGYGELRSDLVRSIRRWRHEAPKKSFDRWSKQAKGDLS